MPYSTISLQFCVCGHGLWIENNMCCDVKRRGRRRWGAGCFIAAVGIWGYMYPLQKFAPPDERFKDAQLCTSR